MTTTREPYAARYEFMTWLKVFLPCWWALAVVFVVAGVLMLPEIVTDLGGGASDTALFVIFVALWVFCILMFAGGALRWTIAVVRQEIALRLDDDGITLGRLPFPPTRQVTVPWVDLEAVVLYERYVDNFGYQPFLGLRLRDGADRPPGVPQPGSLRDRLNRRPAEVSRPVKNWRLDLSRLVEAVRAYAPHVLLVAPDESFKRARNARPQDLVPRSGSHWHGW